MLDIIQNVFGKNKEGNAALSRDEIAALLKVDPKAVEQFEQTYQEQMMSEDLPDNLFELNSKTAARIRKGVPADDATVQDIISRIIRELIADTTVYIYDGTNGSFHGFPLLPENTNPVTNEEIKRLPETLRPELTGNLMKRDIGENSFPHLLFFLKGMQEEKRQKRKKEYYQMFRRGLDTLDLDDITYAIIGMNRNSMGYWLPSLARALKPGFFRIPRTVIAKVPLPLLQLTRLEYFEHTSTTMEIVNRWAYEAFRLQEDKDYFIKTGVFSSKYDFRNAHVHGTKEVHELGEYLLFIHFQCVMMASPLSRPSIYGAATTNEWVVREFIPDQENNPCIYKGLPLHTEYRVFVDCDTKEILCIVPYWDPETMKQHFASGNSMHDKHDYVVYKAHEEVLMRRFNETKEEVKNHVLTDVLPGLDLPGQWSIDIMKNGDDYWIIDMAVAENSTFYNRIPSELRRPMEEDWIPELNGAETA